MKSEDSRANSTRIDSERLSRLGRARVNGAEGKRVRERERGGIPLEIYICIEKTSEKKSHSKLKNVNDLQLGRALCTRTMSLNPGIRGTSALLN